MVEGEGNPPPWLSFPEQLVDEIGRPDYTSAAIDTFPATTSLPTSDAPRFLPWNIFTENNNGFSPSLIVHENDTGAYGNENSHGQLQNFTQMPVYPLFGVNDCSDYAAAFQGYSKNWAPEKEVFTDERWDETGGWKEDKRDIDALMYSSSEEGDADGCYSGRCGGEEGEEMSTGNSPVEMGSVGGVKGMMREGAQELMMIMLKGVREDKEPLLVVEEAMDLLGTLREKVMKAGEGSSSSGCGGRTTTHFC